MKKDGKFVVTTHYNYEMRPEHVTHIYDKTSEVEPGQSYTIRELLQKMRNGTFQGSVSQKEGEFYDLEDPIPGVEDLTDLKNVSERLEIIVNKLNEQKNGKTHSGNDQSNSDRREKTISGNNQTFDNGTTQGNEPSE